MKRPFSDETEENAPSAALQSMADKEKTMIGHSFSSLECEMPVELIQSWITPVPHFFVRNHLNEHSICLIWPGWRSIPSPQYWNAPAMGALFISHKRRARHGGGAP